MTIIAVANHKGGCGKTTTAVNLAAAFAVMGKRVLLIDLDPQAHATLGLGFDPDSFNKTMYDVVAGSHIPISGIAVGTAIEWLHLAPSNVSLATAELELPSVLGKELILGEQLRTAADKYDFCVIDCGPSLGLLAVSALVASTHIIIPVQVHYFAFEGLKRVLDTAGTLRRRFYPCSAEVMGVLLTFVEDRTSYTKHIQHELRESLGALVFDTVIHRATRLIESPGAGQSVLTYDPNSRSAMEYKVLAREVLTRVKAKQEVCVGT